MDSIWQCNTDQAKHLQYTKRKSIYMRLREGGGKWGVRWNEGREKQLLKKKTMKKTNDGESVV